MDPFFGATSIFTIVMSAVAICVPIIAIGISLAFFVPFIMRMVRNSQVNSQVMKTGVDATATIVSTWDTGTRINDDPQVGMRLQVQPPNGAPFMADVTKVVSIIQLAQVQPGAQLNVKYDPANPTHVAIVSINMGGGMMGGGGYMGAPAMGGGMMNPQQTEQMLRQYDAANQQLIHTGMQAPARVLQYMPMNITVNGDNPVVNLMVEVQPVSRPPFNAQASGIVIVQASVPRYQPGQMITVRYNPADLTRVAVEHSGV